MAFSVKLYWTDPITRDVLTIRRLRAPNVPTWLEFVGILQALYGNEVEDERNGMYAVKWLDEENDIITIGSQMEWDEAVASTTRPMKLFVMTQKCTEVTPHKEEKVATNADVTSHEGKTYTVTPKYFYSPAGKVPISTKERQQLSAAVQSVLACYPPPLPQWLTEAVRVFPNGVDYLYDVDIALLTTALHNRARLLVNDGKAADALPLLAHTAALTPCDATPHLDIALCHAHIGDMRRAVVAIKKYYDLGGVDHSAVWAVCDVGNVRESGLIELVRSEFPELIMSTLDEQNGDACDAHVGASCSDDNQSEERGDESDSEDEESEDDDSDDTDSDSSVTESFSSTTSQDDFTFQDDDDDDEEDDKKASVFEYEEVPSQNSRVLGGSDLTEDLTTLDVTEDEDDHAYGSDVNENETSDDESDDDDEDEDEDEEDDEDEMLEQKLKFLEELGFVDRVMVAHVLNLYKGSIEHFIDDQCP